ncbi:MAG TPA: transcription termination factor NusA [Bacillota bacterium]|jgi:N utilization substance protein A
MNREFIDALDDIEREKGISKSLLIEAIEAALISAYRRNFGSTQNVRVVIDHEDGDIRVLAGKVVVEEVADPTVEISLDEARSVDPRYEAGDTMEFEVTPMEFGRIAAQTAKQVVVQRIREAERGIIYEEYSSREGDIVTGLIHRQEGRNILVDLGKIEAVLPPTEQVPAERFRQGERVKAYIVEVKRTTKGPQIVLSRTHPGLVKRLFELEVPEIHDGVVEIKSIAREAGSRTKVAVWSNDERVDAVGACVGPKGMRVQAVVNELRGEKIDVVNWDPEASRFVAEALSPARVVTVYIDEKSRVARAVVPDYQLSLAIGKEGQNARLGAKLTGWKIDIKSETQMQKLIEEGAFEVAGPEEAPEAEPEAVPVEAGEAGEAPEAGALPDGEALPAEAAEGVPPEGEQLPGEAQGDAAEPLPDQGAEALPAGEPGDEPAPASDPVAVPGAVPEQAPTATGAPPAPVSWTGREDEWGGGDADGDKKKKKRRGGGKHRP